jgi:hypothetical protein
MKTKYFLSLVVISCAINLSRADDITTLDGHKYEDVKDVALKRDGLFFVVGSGDSIKGVKVPFNNLPDDAIQKYHCDPYELAMAFARQNQIVYLNKSLAFSLDNLAAAKKKAKDEKKLLGFILEWDKMLTPSRPAGHWSNNALAHFYDVFHDNMVLVFVRHENEIDKAPDAVKQGFQGPDEGGYAPSMAVVTADCSHYICEIPSSNKEFIGREQIFLEKIAVIKKFLAENK